MSTSVLEVLNLDFLVPIETQSEFTFELLGSKRLTPLEVDPTQIITTLLETLVQLIIGKQLIVIKLVILHL